MPKEVCRKRLGLSIGADRDLLNSAIAEPGERVRNQGLVRNRDQWPQRQPVKCTVTPRMCPNEDNTGYTIERRTEIHDG